MDRPIGGDERSWPKHSRGVTELTVRANRPQGRSGENVMSPKGRGVDDSIGHRGGADRAGLVDAFGSEGIAAGWCLGSGDPERVKLRRRRDEVVRKKVAGGKASASSPLPDPALGRRPRHRAVDLALDQYWVDCPGAVVDRRVSRICEFAASSKSKKQAWVPRGELKYPGSGRLGRASHKRAIDVDGRARFQAQWERRITCSLVPRAHTTPSTRSSARTVVVRWRRSSMVPTYVTSVLSGSASRSRHGAISSRRPCRLSRPSWRERRQSKMRSVPRGRSRGGPRTVAHRSPFRQGARPTGSWRREGRRGSADR